MLLHAAPNDALPADNHRRGNEMTGRAPSAPRFTASDDELRRILEQAEVPPLLPRCCRPCCNN
jgi:hypothetical protein